MVSPLLPSLTLNYLPAFILFLGRDLPVSGETTHIDFTFPSSGFEVGIAPILGLMGEMYEEKDGLVHNSVNYFSYVFMKSLRNLILF